MQDYKKLIVWQKSHDLALRIYKLTAAFPKHELYGITSQIRRAAVSVPTNIAEGSSRISAGDFRRFVHFSMGSAAETEYLLQLSIELGYCTGPETAALVKLVDQVRKNLTTFVLRLKAAQEQERLERSNSAAKNPR